MPCGPAFAGTGMAQSVKRRDCESLVTEMRSSSRCNIGKVVYFHQDEEMCGMLGHGTIRARSLERK